MANLPRTRYPAKPPDVQGPAVNVPSYQDPRLYTPPGEIIPSLGSHQPLGDLLGLPGDKTTFGNPFTDVTLYNQDRGLDRAYGGWGSLLSSIATRGIGIGNLQNVLSRMNSNNFTSGLTNALARGAGGGKLDAEAFSNFAPSIGSRFALGNEQTRTALSDLMSAAYVQGGNLFGSGLANSAVPTLLANEKEQRKKDKASGIIGGIPILGGIGAGGAQYA